MPKVLRFAAADGWLALSAAIAFLAVAPIAVLAFIAAQGSGDLWPHLAAYVLPEALRQTAVLLAGVGAIVLVIGVGMAWLVTAYDFPGRKALEWALLLPLAVPTYVVAFAYLDILHPIGPFQSGLRGLLGIENPRDLRLPDIRSMGGCILLLGFVLYPYVYLSSRAMFLLQPASEIEAARSLGASRLRTFLHVVLPFARPGIAVGASLALMETLNDIGAAEFLGVRTLTVSIYTTWINRSSLPGAAQIALLMLAIVLTLILLERWGRRHQGEAVAAEAAHAMPPQRLDGFRGWVAFALAGLPVVFGFLVPAGYLVAETARRIRFSGVPASIVAETGNTVFIASLSTLVALLLGFCVAYATRLVPGQAATGLARAASLGYAVPGTVLAISLLAPLAAIDNAFDAMARDMLGVSTGLLLSGSGAALVYAYTARFLVIPAGGIEAGLAKISLSIDDTARTLGAGGGARLWRLHLPMLQPALATAALLVFVDCMKELPATLLLRPLDFETLATHLYAEAARGTYEDGAMAALLIVAAGLLPVILLSRMARVPERLQGTA